MARGRLRDEPLRLEVEADRAGRYTVEVTGEAGDGAGRYALTHRIRPREDDHGDDADSATRVSVGERLRGTLDFADDEDWIALRLRADTTYILGLQGRDRADGLDDPYLRLVDARGRTRKEDDDSGPGTDARIAFTPDATGLYYAVATVSPLNDRDPYGTWEFTADLF